MGTFSFTHSDRSTHQRPGARAQIAENRKRFQCNLFEFWRQCGNTCRKQRRCLGDPHDCFSRHHAAMPHDHAAWLHADILSRTTGTGTAEQALRAFGLSLPGHIRPDDAGLSPPQQTDDAAPAVDPARDVDDASRRARSWAGILSKSPSEIVAELEKALGMSLTGKLQPEQAGPPPSHQADAEARAVVSERTSPASPGTGSAEEPVRAAGLPPPPDSRSAHASPASPAQADAEAAGPPPPTRPPGVEPWQAWCDDEGRLHMPDPAAVNERFRMLTAGEIYERMRAYGTSA
jgi:hypothetical protein